MKKKKFKEGAEIQNELKQLLTFKDLFIRKGSKVIIRCTAHHGHNNDQVISPSEIINEEKTLCANVCNAIISDSVNRRIVDLEEEFKNL